MADHTPEIPTPIQLDDPGYYILPAVREFSGIMAPANGRGARIRLRLGGAITLDIPVSRKTLVGLAHDLTPHLQRYTKED